MNTFFSILLAVLAFGFLVVIHELGHFIAAKLSGVQVNEFAIGMGPKIIGFKKGETDYSLRILPIGGFCAMEGEDEDTGNSRAFTNKPVYKRLIILVAGSFMNFIAGFVILLILFAPAKYTAVPIISGIADEYTDEGPGGIMIGDRITSINGERVYMANDISLLLNRYYGEPYDIKIERDGEETVLEDAVLVKSDVTFNGEEFYGFGLRYSTAKAGFFINCRNAVYNGIDYVRLVRMGIVDLISGNVGVSDMSGPVGITTVMTEAVSSDNFGTFFSLVAFISINLSVMNMLPLPALDGGRIFFIFVNLVFRLFKKKPIEAKYEGYVHMIGFVLFLSLMVYVTYNDITRLLS